jgi:hypothetical protein
MAIQQGRNGQIKIKLPGSSGVAPTAPTGTYATDVAADSPTVLGNIRSWSLDENVDTVDATVMSTSTGFIFRDVLPSFKSWTLQATVLFDPLTTDIDVINSALFRSGETVNAFIYPTGLVADISGVGIDTVLWGQALITAKGVSSSYDGLIEVALTFEGRKALYVAETA